MASDAPTRAVSPGNIGSFIVGVAAAYGAKSVVETVVDSIRSSSGIPAAFQSAISSQSGTTSGKRSGQSKAYRSTRNKRRTRSGRPKTRSSQSRSWPSRNISRGYTNIRGQSGTIPSLWNVPVSQRPTLPFTKGNVSIVLDPDTLSKVQFDSPAAACALMDFIAQHNSPYQGYARQRLTSLLQQCIPTSAAVVSDRVGRREASENGEGQLAVALAQYELAFLKLIHGQTGRGNTFQTIVQPLTVVAATLDQRDSSRRQANARIILADIHLRLGNFTQAYPEMGKAFELMAVVYENSALNELASQVVTESSSYASGSISSPSS